MTARPIRRTVAVLVAATLTATMAATAIATEVEAAKAKPKCRGLVATIVGPNGPDKLVGTAKRDVLVGRGGNDVIDGRGGNDVICGGPGNDRLIGKGGRDLLYGNLGRDRLLGGLGPDRLFGGASNDVLAGQVGNDFLGGGPGTDICYQGQGTGAQVSCELPAPPPPPAAAPPPAPAPTPPPVIDLSGVLAVAYTDVNGNDLYDTEDVLIAKLVDSVADGEPGNGDTLVMDRYPTSFTPGPTDFGAWNVPSHVVQSAVHRVGTTYRDLDLITANGEHQFFKGADAENYVEAKDSLNKSTLQDGLVLGEANNVRMKPGSPSRPNHELNEFSDTLADDDDFLEVRLLFDD